MHRTPLSFADGNEPPAEDCTGTMSIDMKAFRAGLIGGNPDPSLSVPGTVIDCPWWSRDSIVTVLSNGLESTVEP